MLTRPSFRLSTTIKALTKITSLPWALILIVSLGSGIAILSRWPTGYTGPVDTTGAIYQDSTQPVAARIEDLLGRMSTNEKIGQLALVEKNSIISKSDIGRYGIGAILSGGGAKPDPNTAEAWLAMVNEFQRYAKESRWGIPLLYGVDAVHGHTNVLGATIFPHALGLGASRDEDLVRRVGQATAEEMAATGIYWNFSPSLDVVQDTRWGRTYEAYSSNTDVVSELSTAYLSGLESQAGNFPSVIGTAKHYLGTGAMVWGTSDKPEFKIDQGETRVDEAELRAVHLPPFKSAIQAGINTVMVGHIKWRGVELAASHYWLTGVLKNELGFKGFVVSDWNGVSEIPGGEYRATVTAINAGVDMVMLPYDYKLFTQHMQRALENGEITIERLNDAVRRILGVKFKTGLFNSVPNDGSSLGQLGSAEHRLIAREAVRKSLVLLSNNDKILPLSKATARIVVGGSAAHNLGKQSGGWTIEWQGIDGNWIPGTTILDGIKKIVSENTIVEYSAVGNYVANKELADIGIAVVGEAPYAEGWGDNAHPSLTPEDLRTIKKLKALSKKLVVIIISGRPLDIRPYAYEWDAVVAAWLPGSEGGGVADVLFGDYPFTGTLPVAWPL